MRWRSKVGKESDQPGKVRPALGAATLAGAAMTLVLLVGLFVGGHWVYTQVVGRALFHAQGLPVLPADLVLGLAVLAGSASFFSPCSIAITPAFLTYFVDSQEAPRAGSLFAAAWWIAVGIIGVSAAGGILLMAVGAAIYNVLIYLIPLVGVAFAALGVLMLAGRGASLSHLTQHLPGRALYERLLRGGKGSRRGELITFGVAYGAASHSCTLPVVIGILMLPLAVGNYALAGLAVVVYGIALSALMLLMLTLGQPTLSMLRRWSGPSLAYAVGALFLLTGIYLLQYFWSNYAAPTASSAPAQASFKIVEGRKGSPYLYNPQVLDIPADKPVALKITDFVGGCALSTVFPRLGPHGGTVTATVPLGKTRRIMIEAPAPGRYRYHCSENMYFGEIVAH